MSDAQVVGRVAVKVMPDTSGFKEDLRKKLEKIENDLAITIRTKADATGARKDVLEAVRAINSDNKKTDTRKIRFYTKLDLAGMSGEVSRAVREYQSRANQHRITFSATGRQVVQEARRTQRQAQAELSDLRIGVNLDNQGSVLAAIGRVRSALVAIGETEIDIDLNESSLNAAADMFEERLDEIGHIKLQVDQESESSVKAAVAAIDRELERIAETELKVSLDRTSLEEAKRNLLAGSRAAALHAAGEIQDQLDGIQIRPNLDEQKVAQVKRQLEASFEQMHNLRAQISPELDALAKRKVERDIDDLQDKIDKLKSEIEPEVSRTGIMAVLAHMAVLTRNRVVDIIPKVNASAAATAAAMLRALSGARVLGDMFERLGRMIRNLDKSAPLIGTLSTAIAGLAGWGITAASNLFTMSASLAQIGATSLALPGILGGMAIGIGATVAAFKDFNKVLPGVKGQFSALQDLISSNFWEQAKAPIKDLIDTLLPELRSGFAQTSTQLGSFFGGFATSLKSALAPALGGMFSDLSKSIEIAAGGTEHFANIIKVLGEVGTGYLPQLAQWFVDVAEKASNWLNTKGESGLREEIDAGVQALKDLGGVIFETGGIFAGLARAAQAAGGSTLGMMRQTLSDIHEAVDSSGVQAKLIGLFTAAHEAMSNMASQGGAEVKGFFGEFVGLLTQILPQVGTILGTAVGAIAGALNQSEVFAGVYALFDGIQAAVNALAPAMAPLGVAFGSVLTLVSSLLSMLGPLVTAALVPLSEAFSMLVPAVEPLIGLLGAGLMGIVAALTPLIMTVVEACVPLIEALSAGLAPIIPLISEALSVMSAALQPVIEILMQILTAAILPLIPVVQSLAAEYLPLISEAFSGVMEAIQPFLNALLQVVNFLMPVLAPAIEFIAGLFLGSLVGAINGVADVFTGLWNVFKGVWDMIVGYFKVIIGIFVGSITGDWSLFNEGLKQVWNGIKSFLSGLWDTIKGLFMVFMNVGILGVGKKILTGIKSLWDNIWSGLKSSTTGLWNSIRSNFSSFMTSLKETPGAALRSIQKFFSDTWTNIKSAAGEAWEAVKRTFSQKVADCVQTVRDLPQNVKEIFGDAKSLLTDAGRRIITGLIDGLKSMIGSVKSTLGDLTNKIKDWKGPAPKDAVLLYDAGKLIIQGLIKGLESQYDKVKQSLNDLTAKIPANASKGLRDRINRDRAALLKLAAQWEAGSKRLEAAQAKLDKLREEASRYAQSIADKVISTGDVTKVDDKSFTGISSGLKNAVEQAKKFADVLKRLKTLGLNPETFDQIASAGPEAGLAAAEAIANAGTSGVAEINALQKELEKYAGKAGATASHHMYDAGVKAAEGLVKGLEAQQSAIEAQMLRIADAMVKAIKKALDIHSPSRLFRKLGSFVGKGFGLGVEDERGRVERATNALASSATSGASREVTAAVSGGLKAADSGRSVTKVLNYYAGNGSPSLSSEEELFSAASRARMVGW